jgi:DNA-binding transcriptional ArsR family regulator
MPRSDSAAYRILDALQEHPVLTAGSVMRLFEVSRPAALAALDELTVAGVLEKKRLDGRTSGYLAMDVFRLITFAERQLASTRWDTSAAAPSRAVPYAPVSPTDS